MVQVLNGRCDLAPAEAPRTMSSSWLLWLAWRWRMRRSAATLKVQFLSPISWPRRVRMLRLLRPPARHMRRELALRERITPWDSRLRGYGLLWPKPPWKTKPCLRRSVPWWSNIVILSPIRLCWAIRSSTVECPKYMTRPRFVSRSRSLQVLWVMCWLSCRMAWNKVEVCAKMAQLLVVHLKDRFKRL